MDGVKELLHEFAQELCGGLVESLTGALNHPVDAQEHVPFALRQTQRAAVDVHIARKCVGEVTSLRYCHVAAWLPADAVARQAAVQCSVAELQDDLS